MAVIVDGSTITLTGVVGFGLFEEGFDHGEVVRALATFSDSADLTIRLNSPGGSAEDGIAIHNALRARSGNVHVIIDGLAASAGTIIALGADKVTMSPGSLFMIHEAGVTMFAANSLDVEEARRTQAAFTTSLVEIYCRKTGKSDAEIRDYLSPETWFSAEEAKAAGFIDEVALDAIDITEHAPAFPYQAYAKAPQRLVALAMSRQWNPPAQGTTTPDHRKEQPMSDKTVSASAHATATARIKAIMQDPEAKGRDKLAEHLAFDTAMDAEAAIAIMKTAPAGGDEDDPAALYEAHRMASAGGRRLNGEGLNVNGAGLGGSPRGGRSDGGIVAAMKQRHGAK